MLFGLNIFQNIFLDMMVKKVRTLIYVGGLPKITVQPTTYQRNMRQLQTNSIQLNASWCGIINRRLQTDRQPLTGRARGIAQRRSGDAAVANLTSIFKESLRWLEGKMKMKDEKINMEWMKEGSALIDMMPFYHSELICVLVCGALWVSRSKRVRSRQENQRNWIVG